MLPSSLRELVLGFDRPLLPGILPEGLRLLAFSSYAIFQQTLQPGVIPASAVVVNMSRFYCQELVAGGIPATVRWLRLPAEYRSKDLSDVLSPTTRVMFWCKR